MKNETFSLKVFRTLAAALLFLGSFSLVNLERLEAAPAVQGEAQVINVNRASFDELQAIRGIGPLLAERIIAYREENGPFEQQDDLSNVRGIGGAKLQKIKNQISV